MGLVLNDIEFHLDNRVCFVAMSKDTLAQSGAKSSDTEGLVDYTLYGEGVCVGAFFKEAGDNQTKVSMRSRDSVNVSKIAAGFGGGGHFNAAGCMIENNMTEAKARILGLLAEALNDRP
jgi:phosphoesterase RecJ-like protein